MLEAWRDVRRILAIRLDNIGDVIMLGPSLRALKQALPAAHVTLLASPAGSQIAPLLPGVDEILVHRATWQDVSGAVPLDPMRELALVETLRERHFDAAVIFTSFSQSPYPPAYVCYLAGIPVRLGQSREFGGSLLTHWVKPLRDDTHQTDRNLFLLESAGFPVSSRHLELRIPADVQESADRLLTENGVHADKPFIVLAPGASCSSRRYDIRRFAEVARRLALASAMPLVVVGGKREAELVEPILQATRGWPIVSLVGRDTVPQLVALLRRAALLVANDSGPMHMADALGIPMVILFSGTDLESQWRPRKAPARLLRRPTPCAPCYEFRCPYALECLDIDPTQVAAEALELL